MKEEESMIGAQLKRLRLAKGLTQKELASPNYTHSYVSTIEAGRRQPSRTALEHFADKLGVGVEELVTGQSPDLVARLQLRFQEARIALSEGRQNEADNTFVAVAKQSRQLHLTRLEASAEEARGLLLERRGDPEKALERYQRAEEILSAEPPTALANAVTGKARCFEALGDVRYAIHLLETLLATIDQQGINDPSALVQVHASLLDAYLEAGLHERASRSADELERLAPKVDDPLRLAHMHINVAHIYLVQGNIEDAHRSLERAEDHYRQLHLKAEMGYAHLAHGYIYNRESDLPNARRELEAALEIFEETGDEKHVTRTLNEVGRVERLEGRTDEAVSLLERSIARLGDGDAPILAWAYRELGLTLGERDSSLAEKHLREAIELYERAEETVDIAVSYRALGDLLLARGEERAGYEAYRTGILALEQRY
jgi:tetratricopeptide (TPR) repeat protein